MNPVIRTQLRNFAAANPSCDLDDPSLFEVFSIFSVCNGILTDSVDPFAAHLTGTEFGIDGVAIMVQGDLCCNADEVSSALQNGKNHAIEFNFFQSKTGESIDSGNLTKFL